MSDADIKIEVDEKLRASGEIAGPKSYDSIPTSEAAPVIEPPKYTEDKPPRYDSIFGPVRKAKDESTGNMDYAKRVFGAIFCGTICTIFMTVLCFAIPVASIVIGALNLKNCTIERFIPIYLIVAGTFGVVKACFNGGLMIKKKKQGEGEEAENKPNPLDQLLNCFLVCWFIAGSVWVYRIYGDVVYNDKTSDFYCDKTTYLFAFGVITSTYCFMGLAIFCCCAICCVMCFCA